MNRVKSELGLDSQAVTLKVDQVLCIGCHRMIDKVFTRLGRLYQGIQFIEKPKQITTLEYDEEGELVSETDSEKPRKIPVGKWAKGNICDACVAEHGLKTVTKYRKVWTMRKGKPVQIEEEYFEPVVKFEDVKVWTSNKQGKLVQKASYSTTVNPGWSRTDQRGEEIIYDPHAESELWEPPAKKNEEICYSGYQKFGSPRR